jgi:hypothetical protein
VPRVLLGQIALNVCVDRNQVGGGGSIVTSLFFTQHLNTDDGQAVECRMEWMPVLPPNPIRPGGIAAIQAPDQYMNMNNDYSIGPLNYPNAGRTPNNPLPNGLTNAASGTRGSYVQRMAQQALMPVQAAPPNPPAAEVQVKNRPVLV